MDSPPYDAHEGIIAQSEVGYMNSMSRVEDLVGPSATSTDRQSAVSHPQPALSLIDFGLGPQHDLRSVLSMKHEYLICRAHPLEPCVTA